MRPARKTRGCREFSPSPWALALAVPAVIADGLKVYGSYIFMIGFGNAAAAIATALASAFAFAAVLLAALSSATGCARRRSLPLPPGWRIGTCRLSIAGLVLSVAFAHYNLIGNHVANRSLLPSGGLRLLS